VNFPVIGILVVLGMLGGTICMMEIGRRLEVRRLARDPVGARVGGGAIDAAVLGLMGLLIAFTFTGAAARLDARRAMIVTEANCISTAWLRLDLLPPAAQPPLREKFRQYVDARLAYFRKIPDLPAMKLESERAASLQRDIWSQSIRACEETASSSTTLLVLQALNEMFDTATARTAGTRMHPPAIVYATLVFLLMVSALLAGSGVGAGSRAWVHGMAFVFVMTLTIYVILDFEFPRVGFIRIDPFEQFLLEVRQSMNP
jgi:hypothetical protein